MAHQIQTMAYVDAVLGTGLGNPTYQETVNSMGTARGMVFDIVQPPRLATYAGTRYAALPRFYRPTNSSSNRHVAQPQGVPEPLP